MGTNCPCSFGPNLWGLSMETHNPFLFLTRWDISNGDLQSRDQFLQGRMKTGTRHYRTDSFTEVNSVSRILPVQRELTVKRPISRRPVHPRGKIRIKNSCPVLASIVKFGHCTKHHGHSVMYNRGGGGAGGHVIRFRLANQKARHQCLDNFLHSRQVRQGRDHVTRMANQTARLRKMKTAGGQW